MLKQPAEPEVYEEEAAPPLSPPVSEGGWRSLLTLQTPWWCVSAVLHTLVILLLGLITMAIHQPEEETMMMVTPTFRPSYIAEKSPMEPKSLSVLEGDRETAPTNPNSLVQSEVTVTKDMLLGNHWETCNPDMLDSHAALGTLESHVFDGNYSSDEPPGGGNNSEAILADVIGRGGSPSFGTGGNCMGLDKGDRRGTFGRPGIGGRIAMALNHGGSHKTETGVELALLWLSKHQEVDGHWDSAKYGGKQADVAMTGLALLTFLGAGHTEKIGKYSDNVRRAVYWLISVQRADGSYYKEGEVQGVGYHHAIAGLAMAEAAGMAHVHDTIQSAQRAVDYSIQKHQQGEGSDKRAWRYQAKSSSADISVSGWFIMQLKSARIAGLKVDQAGFDGALKFLDSVEQKGNAGDPYSGNRYGYTSPNDVGVRRTAIGCLSRLFLGTKREDLHGGVEWFMKEGGVPAWGANGGNVDLYYWYYGSLSVFQADGPKGPLWKEWNESMKKALCENQRKGGDENGSWDPTGAYSDYWGRVGQTALAALCLEVYYRYNLMTK